MLELKGIRRWFPLPGGERLDVLRGIDLAIEAGEAVALMGPSGSGKSTLMNIVGLLDRADAGTYLLDGDDVAGHGDDEASRARGRLIGFVFQSFHLIPQMTLVDNVALPLLYQGVPRPERRHRAAELLARVGLGSRLDARPPQLSGGMQQRVAIARSLVSRPRLLIGDEPTGNLDSHTGADILDLLLELNRGGTTLLLVTHDPGVAARAGRTIRLLDGVVVGQGPGA